MQHQQLLIARRILLVDLIAEPRGAAGSEDDFKTAYAAAEAANKEAGKLRNQWTTTAATLAAAKKAGLAHTAHIEGGIDAWKKAGGPVVHG